MSAGLKSILILNLDIHNLYFCSIRKAITQTILKYLQVSQISKREKRNSVDAGPVPKAKTIDSL